MNNLEKARMMRGMAQKELAQRMGISPQSLGQYTAGLTGLGPKLLPLAAEALDVSAAYLRDIAPVLPVKNWGTGEIAMCKIVADTQIEGYGVLYIVEHPDDGVGMLPVIIASGIQFTPWDWQGDNRIACMEDVAQMRWVDTIGNPTIMLDGLPRVFAGV